MLPRLRSTSLLRGLSTFLVYLLLLETVAPYLRAQEPSQEPAQTGASPSSELKIVVLEGNGAINNIRDPRAKDIVVQVLDAKDQPVEGATVSFNLPSMGAGVRFPDAQTSTTMMSDKDGRAIAGSMSPNNVVGEFEVRVSATFHGQTATATVTQTNAAPAAPPKSNTTKIIVILALIGGGAAGAALGLKGGGSQSSSSGGTTTPATTISAGKPVFGAP